ncbi:hypothetical protein THOM_1256, partial [Trachipleistophora hominis]
VLVYLLRYICHANTPIGVIYTLSMSSCDGYVLGRVVVFVTIRMGRKCMVVYRMIERMNVVNRKHFFDIPGYYVLSI